MPRTMFDFALRGCRTFVFGVFNLVIKFTPSITLDELLEVASAILILGNRGNQHVGNENKLQQESLPSVQSPGGIFFYFKARPSAVLAYLDKKKSKKVRNICTFWENRSY